MHWKLWHWWKKLKMTHRWKDTSRSWFGRTDVIKMTILHKAIYRFNAIPIKTFFFFFFFYRTRKKNKSQNLYGNTEDTEYQKQFWEREIELKESSSVIRSCYKVHSHTYRYLVCNKGDNGNKTISSIMMLGKRNSSM